MWGKPWLSNTCNTFGVKLEAEKSCSGWGWEEEDRPPYRVVTAWSSWFQGLGETKAHSRIRAPWLPVSLSFCLFWGRPNFLISGMKTYIQKDPPQAIVEWEGESPILGKMASLILGLKHLGYCLHAMKVLWLFFQLPKLLFHLLTTLGCLFQIRILPLCRLQALQRNVFKCREKKGNLYQTLILQHVTQFMLHHWSLQLYFTFLEQAGLSVFRHGSTRNNSLTVSKWERVFNPQFSYCFSCVPVAQICA